MKPQRLGHDLVVDGLHPLLGERAGVLDALGAVLVRPRVDDAARAEVLPEVGELLLGRVVVVLRLLLGVEVVEVAEELVEAVRGRQELVAVAEVVLAELPGRVARAPSARSRWSGPRRAGRCRRPACPTLVSPVRYGFWPVMNAARPAVQLCSP